MSVSQQATDRTDEELWSRLHELEGRLAESEARYRALAGSLGEVGQALSGEAVVLFFGGEGRATPAPEGATDLLDCLVAEVLALPGLRAVASFRHDDRPTVLEWLQRSAASSSGAHFRLRARDPAGRQRWLEATLTPVHGPDRQLIGMQGIVGDIGARGQADRIVSSLNAAAEVVQTQAVGPTGVFRVVTGQLAARGFVSAIALLDQSGRNLSFAQVGGQERGLRAAEELTGLRRDQAQVPLDRIPAYSRAILRREPVYFSVDESFLAQMLPQALRGVAKTALELLPPLKMVVAPMIVDDDVVGLLAVYGETLTESCAPAVAAFANQTAIAIQNAQLVDRLRESEEQYRGIFSGATDAFLLLDPDGTIIEANPAACAMYGYGPEEMVGLAWVGLVHPSHRQELLHLREAIAREGRFQSQSVHLRKDGTAFHVETRGTRLLHRGQSNQLVAMLDITERIRAQQASLRAEKLRALAQMAGGIAHEFNNILVGIRGYAELATWGLPSALTQVRQDLEHLMAATVDAAQAVSRLQHLYDRADDVSDLAPLQLDDLVSEALTTIEPRLQEQPPGQEGCLALNTRLAAPPMVLGNRRELGRVLARLINNAIEAMSSGGILTVGTGCDGDWSYIAVSDTGPAVISDLPEKAMEPFFTTQTDAEGGLGMAMSINILERHGGELTVDSKPGEGTTFILRLPALRGSASDLIL